VLGKKESRLSMEEQNELSRRIFRFAIDVIHYLRTIENSSETVDIKRQLIRASTSVGANYEESQGASSKKDARNKIAISLKEVRESNYFLRIFKELKHGNTESCSTLISESNELRKILATIFNKLSK
jgi:four helix bundle protein